MSLTTTMKLFDLMLIFASILFGQFFNKALPSANGSQITEEYIESKEISSSQILFEDEDFKAFQKVANDVNFPQIIFFTAPWCNTCHLMEDNVLSDSLVSSYSNKHYMSFKVNVQSFEGYDIKNKYKVQVFPTILILNSKGKKLEKITGYYNSNRLLQKLKKY